MPGHTSAHTSAAGSAGSAASTRSDWPEGDRRLVGHPGELAGADHADHRERRGSARPRARHGPEPYRRDRCVIGSGTIDQVTFVESALAAIPEPYRGVAIKHRELVKFALVGGTTWVIDTTVFLLLKTTVLDTKPLTAKIMAVLVATIASYVLNREWSFRTRGGRERHHEAALFFVISGIGVAVYSAPLAVSRYVLDLKVPDGEPAHPGGRRLRQRPDRRRAGRHGVPLVGVPPVRVPAPGGAPPGPAARGAAARRSRLIRPG